MTQDGSPIDVCNVDTDCDAGCDCVYAGGASIGNCVGGCAPAGGQGAYCTTADDCSAPPLGCCLNFDPQGICYPCSLDAHCVPGETCQTGECQPGPP